MKVAVATDYFPVSTAPWAGHSAYQTLRVLATMCEVQVFYPEAVYPAFLRPGGAAPSAIDRDWSPPDVKAKYIPFPVLPIVSRPLNGFSSAWRLRPHVANFDPDIVLNYAAYPHGLAAVRIARGLGVPSVLTAIGSDLNRISDPLCRRLTQSALRQADFVTTVSHDLAKTAVTLGARPERTRAILNGCDTSVFYPREKAYCRQVLGLGGDDETIVYVGRMDVRKGLLELVEAVAKLRVQRPTLNCFLVGGGPDEPLLRQAIERNGAQAFIRVMPSCPTSQVADWMGAADLVTLPSYKEGCPNVVIEALAAGRPVVATNVGGIPELMDEQSGRLVPPMDVPALTAALDQVLSQRWDAEAISRRHHRGWADVARDLYDVLTETLAEYEGLDA